MNDRRVSQAPGQPGILSLFRPLRQSPKAAGFGLLWLIGLYALFLAPAPVKITPEMLESYQLKLKDAESMMPAVSKAEKRLMDAEFRVKEVSVWFWRFRPDHRVKVEKRQPAVQKAKKEVRALYKQRDAILREAKGALGLWSEAGLEESRHLLWQSFDAGKVIARRQTFWDSIFQMLDSRDKDWFVLLINLLFSALINYTIGTVISVFSFTLSLPSLLWSYSPSWASGIAFFSVAVVSAVSLVATYVALLWAAGTAVVVTTLSFSQTPRRLAAAQQRRENIGYRSHYD